MKYIVTVRGKLKADLDQSKRVHDETVAKVSVNGRQMGNTSHQAYVNTQAENEFFAIDVWDNIEAIQKLYSDPDLAAEFGKLFEGEPEVTIWSDTGWLQF